MNKFNKHTQNISVEFQINNRNVMPMNAYCDDTYPTSDIFIMIWQLTIGTIVVVVIVIGDKEQPIRHR